MSIELSYEEIQGLTHYKRPKEQLEALKDLGIPAKLRKADNTVCVLRMHVTMPPATLANAANDEPKLKSSQK
jgi:hypothetical protein